MGGREDTGWLCDDFTPGSDGASSSGKRRLIWGGGGGAVADFATRISSKVRPQDPRGGGCSTFTVPREGVDIETKNSSVSPVSVVLVEEPEVRCAERLASVSVDKYVRLLARVACPAGVTVCEDCVVMPETVGRLSQSDSDSIGPVGTLSPSD